MPKMIRPLLQVFLILLPAFKSNMPTVISRVFANTGNSITDLLLIEEIKGFALVTGQLLQGAAPLLDGRLNLRGGCVVLDVHGGLHRRLLGRSGRRAKQTAETGGVRAGKWDGKKRKSTQTNI